MEELTVDSILGKDPTDDELKNIVRGKLGCFPDNVRESLENECLKVAFVTKKRIGLNSDSELDPAQEIEMSIQNWLNELIKTIKELRIIFEDKIKELVPEKLREELVPEDNRLTMELLGLILKAKKQIQFNREIDPESESNPREEVKIILENWVNEKLANLLYPRYEELMEFQGKQATPLKRFQLGGLSSSFLRFKAIKIKKIDIDSKVADKNNHKIVYTVTEITHECMLILKGDGESRGITANPFDCEVIE